MTPLGMRIVEAERVSELPRETLAKLMGIPIAELNRAIFGECLDPEVQAKCERWFPAKAELSDVQIRSRNGVILVRHF